MRSLSPIGEHTYIMISFLDSSPTVRIRNTYQHSRNAVAIPARVQTQGATGSTWQWGRMPTRPTVQLLHYCLCVLGGYMQPYASCSLGREIVCGKASYPVSRTSQKTRCFIPQLFHIKLLIISYDLFQICRARSNS